MRSSLPLKVILWCALTSLCAPLAKAQITANFSGGGSSVTPVTDVVDAYSGMPGLGWSTAWDLRRVHPVAVVSAVSPVWGSQHRLQITPDLVTSGSRATEFNVYRTFEGFNDAGSGRSLDITKPFSIAFSLSIDNLRDFLNTPANQVFLGQASGTSVNSTASSIWFLSGFGGENPAELVSESSYKNALQGQWNVYQGKRGASTSTYVPTGILLQENLLYRFDIRLDPANQTYTLSISNGSDLFQSGELVFSNTGGGLSTSTMLSFAQSFAIEESAIFSIGDISITQIPEPSMVHLFLGALGFFLVGRRYLPR